MFYVKKKLADGVEINVDIECDNVYTRCPKCGVEHKVDFEGHAKYEDFELESTAIYCEKCSAELAEIAETGG